MKTVLLFLLCLTSFWVAAQTCTIEFKIKNAGFQVEGTMTAGKIEFNFNPDSLNSSSVVAQADPSTIKTGIDLRDKHLKKRDYFDVAQYPVITMQSTSFEKTGKNQFVGHFNLTIKKTTKNMSIPFVAESKDGRLIYRGSFELNRLDYEVGEKSIILDERVRVFLVMTP